MSNLILHHYPQSPVAHKIRLTFGIAGVHWQSVEIPRVPPKPLLMPLTANYRRTPVLQIGADVYCDSQNIARALGEAGYEAALFPGECHATALLIGSWAEKVLFDLAARLIITHAMDDAPPEFIADRASLYFEPDWTPDGMKSSLPGVTAQLQANLAMVDGALAKTGHMIGNCMTYADAAIGSLAWFIRGRWAGGPDFLAQFANICALEERLHTSGEGRASDLDAPTALAIARKSVPVSPTGIHTSLHEEFAVGQRVMIRPSGRTADPDIFGRLRYLDAMRISIDHSGPEVGDVAIHFPVAGYMIRPA